MQEFNFFFNTNRLLFICFTYVTNFCHVGETLKLLWDGSKRMRETVKVSLLCWSGRLDSNPRPSAWKANALSTELLPHKKRKVHPPENFSFRTLQVFSSISTSCEVWAKMDSNHRSRKTTDLQSAPFGHSGICPYIRFLNACAKLTLFLKRTKILFVFFIFSTIFFQTEPS